MLGSLRLFLILSCVSGLVFYGRALDSAFAAEGRVESLKKKAPSSALETFNMSFFPSNFKANRLFPLKGIDHVSKQSEPKKAEGEGSNKPLETKPSEVIPSARAQLRFVDGNPGEVLPPHITPSVRLNPDAPSSILGMVGAMRDEDRVLADAYADQYVRYMQNYFFEVREITQLIGEALVRQKAIDEDNWDGVGQQMVRELAQTRKEMGALIKPTHDVAMKRIKPDSAGRADVYFFFTMSCSWCRYMAPDVERLWRVLKDDPKAKMVTLTIGQASPELLQEYRSYTGLSAPIYEGTVMAKQLDLGFVPALVVVSPSKNHAYLKTGQQTFERMYEFVRMVQGQEVKETPTIRRLLETPIGQAELMQASQDKRPLKVAYKHSMAKGIKSKTRRDKDALQRF